MRVTSAPLSLVSYYIREAEKVIPTVYRIETKEELLEVLRLGTMFAPTFSLIEYKGKPPADVEVSIFNTVYLCTTEVDSWRELDKSWIEIIDIYPEQYKYKVDSVRRFFEEEAFEELWDRYKNYPRKLIGEVFRIVLANPKKKNTLEDLGIVDQKEAKTFSNICSNLGNLEYCSILYDLSESSLRQLFIGSEKNPPYIYYYLVGKKREGHHPELWQAVEILKEAIIAKYIPINVGAVLFNQWVSQLKKVRLNYKKYEFQFDYKKLIELEDLLKGE